VLLPNGVRLLDRRDKESSLQIDFDTKAGWDMTKPSIYRDALYRDCSNEDVALAYSLLTPEPFGPNSPSFTPMRTTQQNFGRVPRIYRELGGELFPR
jgi:hypothetical protein